MAVEVTGFGAGAVFGGTTAAGCSAGFGVPVAGIAGGLTTTAGGTTVTGRAGATLAGAFATTVPTGGFDAIAG
jgi:hypothetical protein